MATSGYLGMTLACSRCDGPCTPESESATIRDKFRKPVGYLCPACVKWAENAEEVTLADMLDGNEFMKRFCPTK